MYPRFQRLFFFVWRREITRRSRVHEARSAERKKITSGPTNTEPHFRAVLSPGNHAFPKPIRLVVSITVVVSFDEPINELEQILSQFDGTRVWKRISRLLRPEARLLSSILVFRDIYFSTGLWSQGSSVEA